MPSMLDAADVPPDTIGWCHSCEHIQRRADTIMGTPPWEPFGGGPWPCCPYCGPSEPWAFSVWALSCGECAPESLAEAAAPNSTVTYDINHMPDGMLPWPVDHPTEVPRCPHVAAADQ